MTTIIGYHGTTRESADSILRGNFRDPADYKPRYGLWLGRGSYIFQDAPHRAYSWAERWKTSSTPAVVTCEVDLSDCIDLLDEVFWPRLVRVWEEDGEAIRQTAAPILQKRGLSDQISIVEHLFKTAIAEPPHAWLGYNVVDSILFERFVDRLRTEGVTVRVARMAVAEGTPVHPRSWFWDGSSVMICVKDPSAVRPVDVTYDRADLPAL